MSKTEEQQRAAVESSRRWVAKHPDRVRAYHRTYRAQNADALKDRQLQIKFGITLEDYQRMHLEQNGVCRLCKQPEKVEGRALAVDHCHRTGRVRGLLCGHCNRALGFFGHDWKTLLRAAWYVWRRS